MRNPPSTPDQPFINRDTLQEIRATADWQYTFLALGLIRDERQSAPGDWWAKSPFNPDEKTASFHMNTDPRGGGRWYCHSTGRGGGLLDLVQALHGGNIYEAGRWLVDQGCCPLPRVYDGDASEPSPRPKRAPKAQAQKNPSGEKENKPAEIDHPACNPPIRHSLLPMLRGQDAHPGFADRGISAATCKALGCGYLSADHSSRLRGRLVFQVRGVDDIEAVSPQPIILSHMGRATTQDQIDETGKWVHYKGFRKSLELYNIDQLLLDPEARAQVQQTGHLILVEGCFDVAKCHEAGLKNVLASFGTQVSQTQITKLHLLKEVLEAKEILVWFDRDKAGSDAQHALVQALNADNLPARDFEWEQHFRSDLRGEVSIPEKIQDPCDLSTKQIQWLRNKL
ncbi:MAG: toprim domain-containing protein [Paracoccaceae bacterium]